MRILDTYFPVVKDATGRESTVMRVLHGIYFVLLTLLVGSQVVSKFMMSGMQILLAVNWLIESFFILASGHRGTRRKSDTDNSRWLLYAFLVMMGVHVIWLIGSNNLAYGVSDLFRKLPLLAIPLVILTSKPLNRKQLSWLVFFFVSTVFVATIIGLVRHLTIPDLPYRDIVPFISHIRFSLNICVAIVFLLWILFHRSPLPTLRSPLSALRSPLPTLRSPLSAFRSPLPALRSPLPALRFPLSALRFPLPALLIIWFVVFLFILRSYTAFFVLFVVSWVMLVIYWRQMGKVSRWVLLLLTAITVSVAAINYCFYRSYYGDMGEGDTTLPTYTANGNPYSHARDGMIENGNRLNDNVCWVELCSEWPKHSKMNIYDTTPNGYTVYPTLVRYLNARGLTKDSVGVAALSDSDIANIEKGIANPVYVEGSAMRKMCYVLLFEYENYRVYGSIHNSSMLERMALWRGAWRVFCHNPLFGVGTGDGVDELHARLKADGSQIADTEKHAHNQYLSFLVSFGLVGFLLIAFSFFYAFRKMAIRQVPALLAIILILLFSFISEDTMETLAGCVLCTVFPCLLSTSNPTTP